MFGSPRNAARRTLQSNLQTFARAGCRDVERLGPLEARLERDGRRALRIRLAQQGRVFGGNYALEAATAEPVFPATRGLSARGRGVVRLGRVSFHAHRGDEEGRRLAERLEEDERLREALAKVHFDRIRVEPDGRPVIRHLGGSVVWMLFPPLVRPVPLVDEQARALVDALDAFAQAGRR
jgi:hypothetical protein